MLITEKNIESRFKKQAQYFSGKRKEFLGLVPKSTKRLLDVGCGDGSCWKNSTFDVYGIEINPEAAEVAKQHLKFVASGDAENLQLPFEKGFFDCVVFGDVLEHLYDPWGALLKVKNYLGTGGSVLISVPNVRHYRVLRNLVIKGSFSYEESGILDIDHVRFFTIKEILVALRSTGFEPMVIKRNISASGKHKFLNHLLFGALNEFLTEQYYVLARIKE